VNETYSYMMMMITANSQEVSCLLQKLKVLYCVHKSPPPPSTT